MSVRTARTEAFQSLLRFSRASIADPPWFASLLDVAEDEDGVTLTFHVLGFQGRVRVEASDQAVTLRGPSQAVRLCALPYSIEPNGVQTSQCGDLLRVRVLKKRPARASTPSTYAQPEQS